MQEKSRTNSWLTIFSPLLVHFGISFIASMAVSAVIAGTMAPDMINSKINTADMVMQLSNEMMKYTAVLTIVTALFSLPVFGWMFYRDQKKRRQFGALKREKAKIWMYTGIIVLGAAACLVLNNLITLSNLAFYSEGYAKASEALYSIGFPLQLLGLGLIVPITEELLFRGLIYNRLLSLMTQKKAMLWGALIFAAYHGNLVQALYGGILGYLLVYLYEKYGSLKAPIIAHIVLNMTSLIITEYKGFTWMFKVPMRVGIITVVCASLSATMFVLIQRIEGNNTSDNSELTL
ncbi:MAG: CPBP family intramembrane glutamic endopeptidase [Lachnospiraceae bacterium]